MPSFVKAMVVPAFVTLTVASACLFVVHCRSEIARPSPRRRVWCSRPEPFNHVLLLCRQEECRPFESPGRHLQHAYCLRIENKTSPRIAPITKPTKTPVSPKNTDPTMGAARHPFASSAPRHDGGGILLSIIRLCLSHQYSSGTASSFRPTFKLTRRPPRVVIAGLARTAARIHRLLYCQFTNSYS